MTVKGTAVLGHPVGGGFSLLQRTKIWKERGMFLKSGSEGQGVCVGCPRSNLSQGGSSLEEQLYM